MTCYVLYTQVGGLGGQLVKYAKEKEGMRKWGGRGTEREGREEREGMGRREGRKRREGGKGEKEGGKGRERVWREHTSSYQQLFLLGSRVGGKGGEGVVRVIFLLFLTVSSVFIIFCKEQM